MAWRRQTYHGSLWPGNTGLEAGLLAPMVRVSVRLRLLTPSSSPEWVLTECSPSMVGLGPLGGWGRMGLSLRVRASGSFLPVGGSAGGRGGDRVKVSSDGRDCLEPSSGDMASRCDKSEERTGEPAHTINSHTFIHHHYDHYFCRYYWLLSAHTFYLLHAVKRQRYSVYFPVWIAQPTKYKNIFVKIVLKKKKQQQFFVVFFFSTFFS